MKSAKLNKKQLREIDASVRHYSQNKFLFEGFAKALMGYFQNDATLNKHIHFMKYRLKDEDHLREKLRKKALKGDPIPADALFEKVNDLAGIRIIHLHTSQMKEMHDSLLGILDEQKLTLAEAPTANCWDVEYEEIFKKFGISTRTRESMYTTVHYVIQANQKTHVTCEVQVRTLMDEVWGDSRAHHSRGQRLPKEIPD